MKQIHCCKDCTERTSACWSKCERYLKEREEIDKEKELRRKCTLVDSYRTDRAYDTLSHEAGRTIKKNRYSKRRGGRQ
jgi:hypothetical protein